MRYAVAHLRVHLRVWIIVHVSVRTFYSTVCAVLKVVKENIPVMVRQAKPSRNRTFVIRRIKIPVVRSLAEQRGTIQASGATGVRGEWEFSLCRRVTIVRGDANAAQKSGKESEVLLPRELDAGDMRVATVIRLTLLESGQRVPDYRGSGRLNLKDRIGQGLVEPSCLDDSYRFQIVFEQQIIVVSMRGFKGWITDRHPVAARLFQLKRREIGEVRTSNAPSVSRPDVRAPVNGVLYFYARQAIRVGLCPWRRRVRGKRSIRIEFCNGS